MHPTEVLFLGTQKPVSLPVCDHYAGAEKFMRKSLLLQQKLGPVFDITFDCEDGASAGNEAAHTQLVTSIIAGAENRFERIGARVRDTGSSFFRTRHTDHLPGRSQPTGLSDAAQSRKS